MEETSLLRVLLAFAFVIGLILAIAWMIRRSRGSFFPAAEGRALYRQLQSERH